MLKGNVKKKKDNNEKNENEIEIGWWVLCVLWAWVFVGELMGSPFVEVG